MTKLQLNTSHLPVEMLKPLEFVTPSIPITAKQGSDVRTENLTIVFVDIAGFTATTNRQSRLQNANLLERFVRLLKPSIRQFSGHIVKSLGDALLLTFHSPTNAMLCARQLHDRLALHQQQNPELEPIVIRVAAHLGEVRLARHDVFGEAVNLASRIETVTPAGEIYLSEAVFLAMNKAEVPVTSAGQYTLDGFEHQLHLYRVEKVADASLPYGSEFSIQNRAPQRWGLFAILAFTALALLSGFYVVELIKPPTAMPLPTLDTNKASFLRVSWKQNQAIPVELRTEIIRRIQRLLILVPNTYLSNDPMTAANFLLDIETTTQAATNSIILKVTLTDSSNKQLNQQSLKWTAVANEQQLSALENLLAQWLNAPRPQVTAEAMSDNLFNQFLKVQYQFLQAREQQNLDLLQQTNLAAAQLLESAAHNSVIQQLVCDTDITLAEWGHDIPIDRIELHCDPVFENNTAPLLQARWALHNLNTVEAETHLRQALASNSKSMEAYNLLAKVYLNQKKPLDAELVLRQAINFQPDYWPALQQLAVFYLDQGQLKQAISYFRRVVDLTPNNASTLTNLGSAYLFSGDLQSAADIYQEAVKIEPIAMAQTNLATVFYYLGRYDEALELYKKAILTEPSNSDLHGNIADAYRMLNMHDEALFHYKKAISILEQTAVNSRSSAFLAKYYYFSGQQARGLKTLQDAIRLSSSSADVFLIQATLSTHEKQFNLAIQALKQALQYGYPASLLATDPDLQPLTTQHEFRTLIQPKRTSE